MEKERISGSGEYGSSEQDYFDEDSQGEESELEMGTRRFTGESQQIVSFSMGDEEYGVDISQIQEIVRMREVTHIPEMPEFIEGVMNLRGKVVPVVDLRKRFRFESENTKSTRIIVVDITGNTVGLVVDAVSEVLRLPQRTIEPPPLMIAGISREYIKGVGKVRERLIILLDLEKVLSLEEQTALQE